jgi:CRISPR-associated protein Cas5h
MGLSEYLAWIEFHGECTVDVCDDEVVTVDSAVPSGVESVVPNEGVRTHVERMPSFMEADERGRRTTGFDDYTFTTDSSAVAVRSGSVVPSRVGDRAIVFG